MGLFEAIVGASFDAKSNRKLAQKCAFLVKDTMVFDIIKKSRELLKTTHSRDVPTTPRFRSALFASWQVEQTSVNYNNKAVFRRHAPC